jgi:hypothetical protein
LSRLQAFGRKGADIATIGGSYLSPCAHERASLVAAFAARWLRCKFARLPRYSILGGAVGRATLLASL